MIAKEGGDVTAYALDRLADRGTFFVKPMEKVYGGQIVGEQVKEGDMVIQPCEKKHLTNMRASTSDMAIKLTPPRRAQHRAGDRVDQRRRARRGHARGDPRAQADPGPQQAEDARSPEAASGSRRRGHELELPPEPQDLLAGSRPRSATRPPHRRPAGDREDERPAPRDEEVERLRARSAAQPDAGQSTRAASAAARPQGERRGRDQTAQVAGKRSTAVPALIDATCPPLRGEPPARNPASR